ncbi:hypothetical protein DX03_19020 [Stenotrophomonas rhizophila]|nr:hypothetical protein DX03_19020 [Stenotrophomonas rhizophila]
MKIRPVLMSFVVFAASLGALPSSAHGLQDVPPINSQAETLAIAQKNAPINSAVRLQEHLQSLSPDSPLRSFSVPARQRFVASLRFNAAGVTTLRYQDIVEELSYSEAYRVLALFGVTRILATLPPLRSETLEHERIRTLQDPS